MKPEPNHTIVLPGGDAVEMVPLDEIRRRHVSHVLEACNGNRTDAARVLKLDRKTLYRRLLRWGITQK